MRLLAGTLLAALLLLVPAAPALAQKEPVRVKVDKVQVGFPGFNPEESAGVFKSGLWAPILVHFAEVEKGGMELQFGKDETIRGDLIIECADMDGVQASYTQPFVMSANDLSILGYLKPGAMSPEVRLTMRIAGKSINLPSGNPMAVDIGHHVYLTLGGLVPGMQAANLAMGEDPERPGTRLRHIAAEMDLGKLPDRWYGYNAVDLMVLMTDNRKFLDSVDGLAAKRHKEQLQAIAEWVKRGGRLVVSVSPSNQDLVQQLLKSPAWDPPLPRFLSGEEPVKSPTLRGLQTWAEARGKPFPATAENPFPIVKLAHLPQVEIVAKLDAEEQAQETPLVVRMPYGLGCITVLAFDVGATPVSKWKGNVDFWKMAYSQFAPIQTGLGQNKDMPFQGGGDRWDHGGSDLTTQLQLELDKFDSPPISFAWVALFIFLYILVVGPLDYLLLKKVFKKMELTWITFPAVVITVSVIAYFTAYAIKGQELKINKVDLVDVDMRTDLNGKQETASIQVYGTSWFTLLSPRIQSYTVGIEPALEKWGAAEEARSAFPPLVSWLGRPENNGMGGIGRQRSEGLFHRGYDYALDATGIKDVSIPVWTTKSFTASWSCPLAKAPVDAHLHYKVGDQVVPKGTIQNKLPVELQDVWLFYGDKVFKLPTMKPGDQPLKIALEVREAKDLSSWLQAGNEMVIGPENPDWRENVGPYAPGGMVKRIMFSEQIAVLGGIRNHSQRDLDQSWRIKRAWPEQEKLSTREAILVARLPRARDLAETLTASGNPILPSHLWLGRLPGAEQTRPTLAGQMVQDTIVRFYLPVTPTGK